jgi:dihydropyrimidine dehydrogenase (NAD+) subunit PreA
MCARAFDMGWAGVAFKTICLMDIHETSPRFSALKEQNGAFYGFKNIEHLSPHTLEEDLNTFTELKKLSDESNYCFYYGT